jgi:hypothetical protein
MSPPEDKARSEGRARRIDDDPIAEAPSNA